MRGGPDESIEDIEMLIEIREAKLGRALTKSEREEVTEFVADPFSEDWPEIRPQEQTGLPDVDIRPLNE